MAEVSRMVTVARWEWPWEDGAARAGTDIEVQVDKERNRVDLEIEQGIEECVSVRMTGREVNRLVAALLKAQAQLAVGDPELGELVNTLRKLATP